MNIFKIFIAANMFIVSYVSASNIEADEKVEQRRITSPQSPLNPEIKEVMHDMLSLDEVYKSAQAGKEVAPDSDILKVIEKNTTAFIEDLKEILPQVIYSEDDVKRQELVDKVHRKNNPFESFYY